MENYNYIVDINTGERHSIFSETGRTLLKSYIQTYKSGGSFFGKIGKRVKNVLGLSQNTYDGESTVDLDKNTDEEEDEEFGMENPMFNPTSSDINIDEDYDLEEEYETKISTNEVGLYCKPNVTDEKTGEIYPIACRDKTEEEPLKEEGEYFFDCTKESCEIKDKGDYSGLSSDVVSVEKETQTPKPSTKLPLPPPPGVSKNPKTVTQLRGINLVTAPIIKHLRKNIPLPPPAGVSPVPNSVSGARNWSKFEYTTEEGKAIQSILKEIVDNKKYKKTVSIETQNEIFKNLEALLENPEEAREDIELIVRTQKLNPSFFNQLKDVVNNDDYPKSFAFFNDETPTSSAF